MEITIRIRRQAESGSPDYKSYALDVDPGTTVLDALMRIKGEIDGTLAFRKNCRNAICGSCAMRINGRSALACASRIRDVADARGEILIQPMGNMPVIKDLVVDMSSFWQHLDQVDPYVSTASRRTPEKEFLQTPEERAAVEQAGNCILCGACYSECNSREVNPNFVGPHALAKAQRVMADNRDDQTAQRHALYNQPDFAWGCTRCFYCNEVCPMGVQPLDQIQKIRHELLIDKASVSNTAMRHRRVMVRQLKESGWLDEARFALQVVGRDWKGLWSLVPLGVRMAAKGKMPLRHRPIEHCEEVRDLVEEIQKEDAKS
ncbi:succinate dehydrogenase/fumarate reductase iron-sulfur subunit [Gloeobacter morelensis]|uniref:Fumarate reductase iron-sulfur subunit n=1 Tax=Gloeobacter morelensis MG652769 TaxID=2781736 RepID=A0ABY3PK95_9CYAN|nr:succinate dehydrogenase/fumarate reductase iron-sulfur subunit [Gloeobacter morelensis]UFP94096.1 succinate dehydrogenase/fumarate reductase iron-sulfur subunit [Gloeobacter morelensis MG652769]